MKIIIRSAVTKDIKRLLEIEGESFPDSLKLNYHSLWQTINILKSQIYCLEVNKQIISYMKILFYSNVVHIDSIATSIKFRKKGHATVLLHFLKKKYPKAIIRLCVNTKNRKAMNLYKNNGYIQIQLKKNYYGLNENAYLLENK